jgi:hypothetical protein
MDDGNRPNEKIVDRIERLLTKFALHTEDDVVSNLIKLEAYAEITLGYKIRGLDDDEDEGNDESAGDED